MRRVLLISLFGGVAATTVLADFSYEQTTQMTGGAMMSMMRMAGPLAGKAREPQKNTVIVKGNKLAHVYADHAQIIDLDAETFTDLKFKDKTYSVITFAQMKQAMDAMAQKYGQARPEGDTNFKLDVKDTGQTKVISGLNTAEKIMTITFETTDPKTGQKGTMVVTTDMWMAPEVPGYAEVRDFHTRMAKKIAFSAGGAPNVNTMPGGAGMGQGMALIGKEAAKLQGVPVLQITKIGGEGMDAMASSQGTAMPQQQQQQQQGPPMPSGGQVANDAARSAATSAITSRMGRAGAVGGALGGFGRKKKPEEAPPQAPAPQAPQVQQAPPAAAGSGAGPLMETTTELTGFASTADVSKFSVPAGYKQVEHDMLKMLK